MAAGSHLRLCGKSDKHLGAVPCYRSSSGPTFRGRPPSLPLARAAFDFALLLTLPRFEASQDGQTSGVPHCLHLAMVDSPVISQITLSQIRFKTVAACVSQFGI
jgi:hypothetical protein